MLSIGEIVSPKEEDTSWLSSTKWSAMNHMYICVSVCVCCTLFYILVQILIYNNKSTKQVILYIKVYSLTVHVFVLVNGK